MNELGFLEVILNVFNFLIIPNIYTLLFQEYS